MLILPLIQNFTLLFFFHFPFMNHASPRKKKSFLLAFAIRGKCIDPECLLRHLTQRRNYLFPHPGPNGGGMLCREGLGFQASFITSRDSKDPCCCSAESCTMVATSNSVGAQGCCCCCTEYTLPLPPHPWLPACLMTLQWELPRGHHSHAPSKAVSGVGDPVSAPS